VTSASWRENDSSFSISGQQRAGVRAGLLAFSAVFIQLVLGAWMRHSDAGLSIPDFPTSFGGLVPDHWDARIAVAFAHRVWALVVVSAIFSAAVVVRRARRDAAPRRISLLLAILMPSQIVLGSLSVWTRKAVPVTVAHQTTGAVILAATVALTLVLARKEGAPARALAPSPAWAAERTA